MDKQLIMEIENDKQRTHDGYIVEILDDLISVYKRKSQKDVAIYIKDRLINIEMGLGFEKSKGMMVSKIMDVEDRAKALQRIEESINDMMKQKIIYSKYLRKHQVTTK